MELKNIVEALLLSAERPLTYERIRTIFAEATGRGNPSASEGFRGLREAQIAAALGALKADYDLQLRSFQLVEIAGGWRLVSRPITRPG